jgi:transposase
VERCRAGDRSVGQVARDFDLTETAVRAWVTQAETDAGERPGLSSDERAELARLRRENRSLREDVEVLKRAPGPGTDRRYAGDITYIATWQGCVYLATVIDLSSRKVVGWGALRGARRVRRADRGNPPGEIPAGRPGPTQPASGPGWWSGMKAVVASRSSCQRTIERPRHRPPRT